MKRPGTLRLDSGGLIERDWPLSFTFDGQRLSGYRGDTLASALLANGLDIPAISRRHLRRRGLFAPGFDEPNALVQLETGARAEANLRATRIELYDRLSARSLHFRPGFRPFRRRQRPLSAAPDGPDPDRYEQRDHHCDVLVIGGGAAGLAAALGAARSGARVAVTEQDFEWGGRLLTADRRVDGGPAIDWIARLVQELTEAHGALALLRTTVVAGGDGPIMAIERVTEDLGSDTPPFQPKQRLWRFIPSRVILAAGAAERPFLFRDNDLPGVMLSGAVEGYVRRFAVRPGSRAIVLTNNDDAYGAADALHGAGAAVAVVDVRHDPQSDAVRKTLAAGIGVHAGMTVMRALGRRQVRGVEIMALGPGGESVQGAPRRLPCDLLCVSAGWIPSISLATQAGAQFTPDPETAEYSAERMPGNWLLAGGADGVRSLETAIDDGYAAGRQAARAVRGRSTRKKLDPRVESVKRDPDAPIWITPAYPRQALPDRAGRIFADPAADVTLGDLLRASGESPEASSAGLADALGLEAGSASGFGGYHNAIAGLARFGDRRPCPLASSAAQAPHTPLSLGALAGRRVGRFEQPYRRAPAQQWHEDRGATFVAIGPWRQPYCYPHSGETDDRAIARESRAGRQEVALYDASATEQIDLYGIHAEALLAQTLANDVSRMERGACREGVVCARGGQMIDTILVARMEEHHFRLLIRPESAQAVRGRLFIERRGMDQRSLPQIATLRDTLAAAAVIGPLAGRLLAAMSDDIDFSRRGFPDHQWRSGRIAGLDAWVVSAGETGGRAFQVHVEAGYAVALWRALMTGGEKYGITPLGRGALDVLRIEAGRPWPGREIDGTATPFDLGFGAERANREKIAGRDKERGGAEGANRWQLVGLRAAMLDERLPAGGLIVEHEQDGPEDRVGHVTSPATAANSGLAIALGLVADGRQRTGGRLYVLGGDRPAAVTVSEPDFLESADGAEYG